MGVKHVEAYGDPLLVVQQVSKVCQCLNGILNAYLDKCLDIISCMDEFMIYHVSREENPRANALAQQASCYNVRKRNFQEQKPVFSKAKCSVLEESVRPMPPTGLTGDTGLTDVTDRSDRYPGQKSTSANFHSKDDKDVVNDWRKPLIDYLQDPSSSVDKKIRRWALKFILDDGELYRRTADDLLLKCSGPDQAS